MVPGGLGAPWLNVGCEVTLPTSKYACSSMLWGATQTMRCAGCLTPFETMGTILGRFGLDRSSLRLRNSIHSESRSPGRRTSTIPCCKAVCGASEMADGGSWRGPTGLAIETFGKFAAALLIWLRAGDETSVVAAFGAMAEAVSAAFATLALALTVLSFLLLDADDSLPFRRCLLDAISNPFCVRTQPQSSHDLAANLVRDAEELNKPVERTFSSFFQQGPSLPNVAAVDELQRLRENLRIGARVEPQ